jgi:hypothetical protein
MACAERCLQHALSTACTVYSMHYLQHALSTACAVYSMLSHAPQRHHVPTTTTDSMAGRRVRHGRPLLAGKQQNFTPMKP